MLWIVPLRDVLHKGKLQFCFLWTQASRLMILGKEILRWLRVSQDEMSLWRWMGASPGVEASPIFFVML